MKIHKEGRKFIKYEIILIILLSIIYTIIEVKIIEHFIVFLLFICVISIVFFRIPNRVFYIKDGIVYSPCDGKVVVIEETLEKEFYKDKRIQISIFMSPLNIHNNLNPISGKVNYKKYHPGRFLFAWKPKASTDNERSTLVIENNKISVLCRQIAGAFARRIITYPKINEDVKATNEMGFIKFGSRVDLFLPTGTKIITNIGNNVKGGQSIIARY